MRRYASHGTTRQNVVDACGGVARFLLATKEFHNGTRRYPEFCEHCRDELDDKA